jgi:erythromycin esterase-like protein
MDVTKMFAGRPQLLGLGEPTHGDNNLLDLRNRLFRRLVEREGYRTIALESDCLKGLTVDDYVTTGEGDLDEVVRNGFSHEWGHFQGNRDLVRWMRAHNEGRPREEQVRFAGFDGPLEITAAASPRRVLSAIGVEHDEEDDDRWTNPAAMMDPSQSIGRTPEADQLRITADNLVAQLETQPDPDERTLLYARTAVGLLRYHHWMADPSPARLQRLTAQRDAMMAANLLALADRGPTLVYAHNSHLQRDRSTMRMGDQHLKWWGAGALVSAKLGPRYAFLATAVGTIHEHGVGTPPPDTLEGHLYGLPEETALVARQSPWYGYAPLDPANLPAIDGVVFVRDVTPAESASARTGPTSGTRTP